MDAKASTKSEKPSAKPEGTRAPRPLATPSDLPREAVEAITAALNGLVVDAFALYVKTKTFHWHVSGPHFRDYHLLLDEQAAQIFASIDPLAERVRKLGGGTIRSVAEIAGKTRVKESSAAFVAPLDMLRELLADNKAMAHNMRQAHAVCDEHEDAASAGLLENFIDETERRTWFLFEAGRSADGSGH